MDMCIDQTRENNPAPKINYFGRPTSEGIDVGVRADSNELPTLHRK